MGCDEAQGWYLARPMAAPNATAWLLNRMAISPGDLDDLDAQEVTA